MVLSLNQKIKEKQKKETINNAIKEGQQARKQLKEMQKKLVDWEKEFTKELAKVKGNM